MSRLIELWRLAIAPIRAVQRAIDVQILWPQCCRIAGEEGPSHRLTCGGIELEHPIDNARAAFACHAMSDSAWRVLGSDEICRQIDRLEWRLP